MSTPLDLVKQGRLKKFEPECDDDVFEIRRIFLLPKVENQVNERVRGTVSDRNIEIEPEAQLDALLADFCEGEEIDVGTQVRCLTPVGDGVWELKTPDLRLFGWFQHKDCFIWTAVDAKWRLLEIQGLVHGYIKEAVRAREQLFGENPGHVEGDDPNDVISNWY